MTDRAHPRRILIVEDDFLIAMDTELTLESAGYRVVGIAPTEDDAVANALRERPDLILMDLRLANDGCGKRAAERIRAEMEVDIVFASGNISPDICDELSQFAPVAMLSKPYLDTQLLEAVGRAA